MLVHFEPGQDEGEHGQKCDRQQQYSPEQGAGGERRAQLSGDQCQEDGERGRLAIGGERNGRLLRAGGRAISSCATRILVLFVVFVPFQLELIHECGDLRRGFDEAISAATVYGR